MMAQVVRIPGEDKGLFILHIRYHAADNLVPWGGKASATVALSKLFK